MEIVRIAKGDEEGISEVVGRCPLFRALKPEDHGQIVQAAEPCRFEVEEEILRICDVINGAIG